MFSTVAFWQIEADGAECRDGSVEGRFDGQHLVRLPGPKRVQQSVERRLKTGERIRFRRHGIR